MIVAGEKEQPKVAGMPVQLNEIALFSDPDCICALTVRFPDIPAAMVRDCGAALKDKTGVGVGVGPGVGVGLGGTGVGVGVGASATQLAV